ncbi:MAG: hypothetical protein K2M41_06755 [Muribaculaceae bacterium]|nr:hypothetical protein [Muribaculaceae bacterium]
MRRYKITASKLLILSIVFYIAGLFAMQKIDIEELKKTGAAEQEITTYINSDGEEQESESFIEIDGIGPLLTYKDIYLSVIPFTIISCILGRMIFNSTDEIRFMIYTNCIIGLLLVWLTTWANALSTILYWCGVIAGSFIPNSEDD